VLAAADQRAGAADIDDRDGVALGGLLALRLGLAGLDPDPVVGDQDLVVMPDLGGGLDLDPVDEGAVVRAEVLDLPRLAGLPQPGVLARHAHVRDEDLAIRAAADDILAVRELVAAPSDRSSQEHQRGHPGGLNSTVLRHSPRSTRERTSWPDGWAVVRG